MKNFSTSSALFSGDFTLNFNGHLMDLSTPRIAGIINVTPDSFYPGSRITDPVLAVERAREMFLQGADLLDVGAASSRPGSLPVSEQEELDRIAPVIESLRNAIPECILSIDTWRSRVARELHTRYRIDMVNDISGGEMDPTMFSLVAELGIPYVVMHMKGTPETMQTGPEYHNVVDEVLQYFGNKVSELRKRGVADVIIDPGFGFGKTKDHNYRLLQELDTFRILELPMMVGLSRKSMIYNVLDTDPGHSLNGTTSAHMAALLKGANLLRVHDVEAASQTVKIFQQIVNAPGEGV